MFFGAIICTMRFILFEYTNYINTSLNWLQVRRTKISERMRKLQDLVPNMDKVLCFMIGFNICKVWNHTLINVNALRYNVVSLLFLKQTNTADMLDLAVDYIKDLQKQAQVISYILYFLIFFYYCYELLPNQFSSHTCMYLYRSFKIVKQSVRAHTSSSNNNNGKEWIN